MQSNKDSSLSISCNSFEWNTEVDVTPLQEVKFTENDDILVKKSVKYARKKSRILAAKKEEDRLRELESARLITNRVPDSTLDYEELLQANKHSSVIWIHYISFCLQNAEIEKAKQVAKQAVESIPAKDEKELLNAWIVRLKLEVLYGSENMVKEVYEEALKRNEPLHIHMALALIYADINKIQDAECLHNLMMKKYPREKDVWYRTTHFYLSHGMLDEGRKLQKQMKHNLKAKDYIEVIVRYAILEIKFGDSDASRQTFETILMDNPKRLDIWYQYVDCLIKHENYDEARKVFHRMTGLNLKLIKMRSIFRRFQDFENQHGNIQQQIFVKNKIQEFVSSALNEHTS